MDVEVKIRMIATHLNIGEYTPAAKECCGIIEQSFRELFRRHLMDLEERDRIRAQESELMIGKGEKGIESFTMGQLIGLFRKSKFLVSCARVTRRDLSGIRMINFDELNAFRNRLMHDGREATRCEAAFLFNVMQIVVETFGLIGRDDICRIEFDEESGATTPGCPSGRVTPTIIIIPNALKDDATKGAGVRFTYSARGASPPRDPR